MIGNNNQALRRFSGLGILGITFGLPILIFGSFREKDKGFLPLILMILYFCIFVGLIYLTTKLVNIWDKRARQRALQGKEENQR